MTVRHSSRGDFFGCTRYPNCRGTRSVDSRQRELLPEPQQERKASSDPTADLVTALRRAAGIDLLQPHGPQIDRLLSGPVDSSVRSPEEDVPF